MHKYGVVYLNRGNDLYVAIDMSRVFTNFIGPQACKNWMLKSLQFYFLTHWKKLERGDFAPLSRFGAKSSRERKPNWLPNLSSTVSVELKI